MNDPASPLTFERWRGALLLTDDPGRLDLDLIHGYLSTSYWAAGIPRAVVERSIRESLSFGLYDGACQVGFARFITDRATFAYLADVFVLESHRGRGLATWMMEGMLAHPDLQGLRRFVLVTRNAHGLYKKFGFTAVAKPERYMEIVNRDPHKQ